MPSHTLQKITVILCVLTCFHIVRAQDSTGTDSDTAPAALSSLAAVDDVLSYANDTSRKILNDHPGATSLSSQWPDTYIGQLSSVDHKTLITAITKLPRPPSNPSEGERTQWLGKYLTQALLEKAIIKYSTQADLPDLLAANTADTLYVIEARKWQDDPQVTTYLLTTLQQFQTTPPQDADTGIREVLRLARQSHDPKVQAALAVTMPGSPQPAVSSKPTSGITPVTTSAATVPTPLTADSTADEILAESDRLGRNGANITNRPDYSPVPEQEFLEQVQGRDHKMLIDAYISSPGKYPNQGVLFRCLRKILTPDDLPYLTQAVNDPNLTNGEIAGRLKQIIREITKKANPQISH